MTDFASVGQQFVNHYYSSFKDKAALAGLYTDQSLLTYEGEQFMGVEAIMGKLSGLPNIDFDATNAVTDFQPSVNEGIFAMINCSMAIDGGQPLRFTQTFLLQKGGEAGYYVHNEVFRLSLG